MIFSLAKGFFLVTIRYYFIKSKQPPHPPTHPHTPRAIIQRKAEAKGKTKVVVVGVGGGVGGSLIIDDHSKDVALKELITATWTKIHP